MKKLLLSAVTTLIIGSSAIMTSAHAAGVLIVIGNTYRAVECGTPDSFALVPVAKIAADAVCFIEVNK